MTNSVLIYLNSYWSSEDMNHTHTIMSRLTKDLSVRSRRSKVQSTSPCDSSRWTRRVAIPSRNCSSGRDRRRPFNWSP
jgi:hypothetical protein